jgi:hypothetical protein
MKIGKKILVSFVGLMVVSALIHIGILIFAVLERGDIRYLNYFRILGLNEFFPKISNGYISNTISFLVMVSIFTGFWLINIKKNLK